MVKLYQEATGNPCNTAIAIFLAKTGLESRISGRNPTDFTLESPG
jgi:hypothetical protein